MKKMKPLISVFLILILVSAPGCADNYQDGADAYKRGDYKTAFEKWKPLAEKGYAQAQFNLGLMYRRGEGVTQDNKEAVKWFRFAAEKGHPPAQNNLGEMYIKGHGVTQDYEEAVKWFRLSAGQGNAHAQSNLGVRYFKGQGVMKDFVQADMWFNIAGANGYEDEEAKNRDILENQMTPDQIAEAQKLAREWLEEHRGK